MKTYVNIDAFWRHGLLVAPGTPLELSDAEAKYIRHNLVEVTDDIPADAVVEGEVAKTVAEVEAVEGKPAEEAEAPRRTRK